MTVVGIHGSCCAGGYDLDPENKYMKCVDNVIYDSSGKELMSYPQNISDTSFSIPEGTEFIGEYALSYTSVLERVTIPKSVRKIGLGAFVGSLKLSEVIFEPNDSGLYIDAFSFCTDSCTLKEVKLPSFNVKIDRTTFGELNEIPLLFAYEQPILTGDNRTVKWNKIPYASYYELYQKLSNDEYKLLKTTKSVSCRFRSLKPGKDYTFAVKPMAVIPSANYDKEEDEGYYPETFTIEGTMSEDVVVKG